MAETKTIELTAAQAAMWAAFTDQRCANFVAAADFIADLSDHQKAFLSKAKPETLEFLADLRAEEVKGLQAYLLLRSTSKYLFWGVTAILGGLTTVLILWDKAKVFFMGSK
jgi:hypothetical protein